MESSSGFVYCLLKGFFARFIRCNNCVSVVLSTNISVNLDASSTDFPCKSSPLKSTKLCCCDKNPFEDGSSKLRHHLQTPCLQQLTLPRRSFLAMFSSVFNLLSSEPRYGRTVYIEVNMLRTPAATFTANSASAISITTLWFVSFLQSSFWTCISQIAIEPIYNVVFIPSKNCTCMIYNISLFIIFRSLVAFIFNLKINEVRFFPP